MQYFGGRGPRAEDKGRGSRNTNTQGKYPDGVQIFTFLLEHRFALRQRFQKKFHRWQFDQKMCLKGISCCSFHG